MKILVDPSIFRYGRCGLARYYAALCDGLRARGIDLDIPLVSSNCDFQSSLSRRTRWMHRIPYATRLLNNASTLLFRRAARKGAYDWILVTSPQFDASFLNQKAEARFVMVVHDLMTCVTAPDGLYDAAGPGLAGLLYLASRASLLICISNDTRDALASQNIVDPARLTVISTGNLLAGTKLPEKPVTVPPHYLLFVGERSGRKGFFTLVRALKPVLLENSNLALICTGSFSATEKDYLHRHGILRQTHAILADDGTLITLYRNALCLLYPSLYEGFGLPVIEAMHYGCPVLTTREGALAETVGDAGLILDPFDVEGMTATVRDFLIDPTSRNQMIERGYVQAAKFDVDQMLQAFHVALVTNLPPKTHKQAP